MTDDTRGTGGATRPGSDLDDLFAQARGLRPGPDLVERVLADAQAVQAAAAPAPAPAPRRGGLWRNPPGWVAALGGWGGFSGVTVAGLVGLAVGFWSPDMVDTLSGGQLWSLSVGSWSPDLAELAMENGDV